MSAVGTGALGFSSREYPKRERVDDTTLTADAQHATWELFAAHRDVSFAPAKPIP
ncbi:hypothetical protein GCM10027073_61230 [Streptomyces chlorus]